METSMQEYFNQTLLETENYLISQAAVTILSQSPWYLLTTISFWVDPSAARSMRSFPAEAKHTPADNSTVGWGQIWL